jgi:hypothetical protein
MEKTMDELVVSINELFEVVEDNIKRTSEATSSVWTRYDQEVRFMTMDGKEVPVIG